MNNTIFCDRDCPTRTMLCHTKCERYLAARAEQDRKNEERHQQSMFKEIERDRIKRISRAWQNHTKMP